MPGEQLVALVLSAVAIGIALGSLVVSYRSFKRSGPQLAVHVKAVIERAKKETATTAQVHVSVVNSGQAAIQIRTVECLVRYRRVRLRHRRLDMTFRLWVEGGATRLEGFHTKSCLFSAPVLMLSLLQNKGHDAWLVAAVYTGSGNRIASKPLRISRYALSDGLDTSVSLRTHRRISSIRALKILASIHLPERVASGVGLPARHRNSRKWREWRLDRVKHLAGPQSMPTSVEFVDD